jgi:drug/metabolite transporter (DMT)-like permease
MHGSGKRDLASSPPDGSEDATDRQEKPGLLGAAWRWLFGRPYLLLILTTLGWAGNAVASRLAVGEISPMALTTLRWGGVCALLAVLTRRQVAAAWPILRFRWPYILALAATGFTAFNALMYAAAHSTSAVNLTILQGAIPIFVLVGALAVFGTRIRTLQALGAVVTLGGVALVAARGDFTALIQLDSAVGDIYMLVAYAGYTLALRNRLAVPAFAFFAVLAGAALLVSIPLLLAEIAAGTVIWPTGKRLVDSALRGCLSLAPVVDFVHARRGVDRPRPRGAIRQPGADLWGAARGAPARRAVPSLSRAGARARWDLVGGAGTGVSRPQSVSRWIAPMA